MGTKSQIHHENEEREKFVLFVLETVVIDPEHKMIDDEHKR